MAKQKATLSVAVFKRYFSSVRTWRLFVASALSVFGALAAALGAAAAFYPDALKKHAGISITGLALVTFTYTAIRIWPTLEYTKHLGRPNSRVSIVVGDLFAQEGDLVIGMSDTFDTEPPTIISRSSVQGQFLKTIYSDNVAKLDRELEEGLRGSPVVRVEDRADKPLGKLTRYSLGTTAVLDGGSRKYFCVAYASMNTECMVETTVDQVWASLASLWKVVRVKGDLGVISMAVVGSGLTRLTNQLSHSDLVKLAFMSFLIASRQQVVAQELRIIVRPEDAAEIDLRSLFDFMAAQ